MQKAFVKDDILEFFIDDLDAFAEIAKDWPLKGAISIRKNPSIKIHITFSQDESIFLHHSLKKFYWSFEDYAAQRNANKGIGIMCLLLISHKFGWTFSLSDK